MGGFVMVSKVFVIYFPLAFRLCEQTYSVDYVIRAVFN